MQFICHPVAMGIYGKIGKDERTGASRGASCRFRMVKRQASKKDKDERTGASRGASCRFRTVKRQASKKDKDERTGEAVARPAASER